MKTLLNPLTQVKGHLGRKYRAFQRTLFVKRTPIGIFVELDPWEWYQNTLRINGKIEPLTEELYSQLLRKGDVVIDVGAHIGWHSLLARKFVGESGKIIAIEPQFYNAARIITNFHHNNWGNITVFAAAVSDKEGSIILQEQPFKDRARLSLNGPSLAGDQLQKFRVPLVRLDTVCRETSVKHIRLLKIDTEGHELQAFLGIGEILSNIDNIIVEVWDPDRDEYRQLARYLREAGYILRRVDGKIWNGEQLPEINLWASRDL